jgi:hypothetical protein
MSTPSHPRASTPANSPDPRATPAAELSHRFAYHPPRSRSRVEAHEKVRTTLLSTTTALTDFLPPGRETSLVVTKLEEAMFWANAALARAEDPHATVSEEEAAAGPRPAEDTDPGSEGGGR